MACYVPSTGCEGEGRMGVRGRGEGARLWQWRSAYELEIEKLEELTPKANVDNTECRRVIEVANRPSEYRSDQNTK